MHVVLRKHVFENFLKNLEEMRPQYYTVYILYSDVYKNFLLSEIEGLM